MKICFVVTEIGFFLSHRFALAKEISNKHNVVLITDPSKAKPEDFLKLESAGIEIIPLKKRPNTSTLIEYSRFILELRKKIKACSPEYIFYTGIEISMFGALIHHLISTKKTFFLVTGIGPFFLANDTKRKLFRAVNKFAYLFLNFKKNFKFIFQNQDDMNLFINKNLSPFYPQERSINRLKQSIYLFFKDYCRMNYKDQFKEIINLQVEQAGLYSGGFSIK